MEKNNKRKKLKIGGFIVILFLMVYIPSFFHWVYGKTITTDIIRMGTIEDSVNVDGIVVRKEEVLVSPFEGKCIREAEEGDKIPANFRVATIINDSSEEILDNIKELDMRITSAQKEKAKNQDVFSDDIKKLDEEIEKYVGKVIAVSNTGSLSEIKQYKNEIDGLIRKKAMILGNTGKPDAFLDSLYKEKQRYQEQLKQNTKEIISKSPGIISYVTDGYEASLNPDSISQLTPKIIGSLKTAKPVRNSDIVVHAGKPFAKIIKDFEYYMVFVLDAENANKYKVGDEIKVRINDISQMVNATVEYKSNEDSGKYVVAVKTDEYSSDVSNIRRVNADLIKSFYSGLKVPISSLKDVDLKNNTAKIVIDDANYASIREVKIKGRNKEYAIIESSEKQKQDSISL